MNFDSLQYLLFLPAVYVLYRLLSHAGQNRMLLVASYFFYGCWDVRFLSLIMLSTAFDYASALMIDRGALTRRQGLLASAWAVLGMVVFAAIDWRELAAPGRTGALLVPTGALAALAVSAVCSVAAAFYTRFAALPEQTRRRAALIASLIVDLGVLGFFKYFNFFAGSFEQLLNSLGFEASHWHLDVVLPVGVSFYTFQAMSYTIDVYRGRLRATPSLADFALFVSFFPQLVAGPIERATHLLPALVRERSVRLDQSLRGLHLILLGLFKKVAIANGVAQSVDSIYNSTHAAGAGDVALATLLFAVQIYCDFSAYTDIARGSGKLLGIDLIENFRQPYFSTNPSEFWRRWHISLSTWLRDYLYIPLGGNRGSQASTYRNLAATMLLGGLWHGAAWNFVLWGAFHGAILCAHRFVSGGREPARNGWTWLTLPLFFAITCYGWLLFRANSFAQIAAFSTALATGADAFALSIHPPTFAALIGLPLLFALEAFEHVRDDRLYYLRFPVWSRGALYAAMVFVILLGTSNEPTQFIYFQF